MFLDPGALGTALLNSVQNGDTPETLSLLQAGANPNAERDARGNTALHFAALYGQDGIARALVDAGACTEALTKDDRTTPLRLAAERGHLRTVQVLLDAAANMEAEDALDRATPLHSAAEAGHTSVVEELVRRGANIEARASSGQTPLRWALSLGRARTARVLLQLGADPDAPDRLGACCLHAVAGLGWEPTCDDSEWESVGECMSSSSSPSAMMAELLLASGASVGRARCRPPSSMPHDGEDVVGVGVANACFGGETPLHIAARESSLQVVKVLLENGSDPNARTCAEKGGFSPLHSAVAPGSGSTCRSVVRVLLEAGADVDSVAADGMTTPLRLACQNAAVGCVEELLRWDAYDISLIHPSSSVRSSLTSIYSSNNGTSLQTPAGPPFHPDAPPGDGEMGGTIRGAVPPLSAVVGSRVPLSVKDPEDEKRIHDLLRVAPYDRAWRRRSWLVILNTRVCSGTIEQRRRLWDCESVHSAAYHHVHKKVKHPEPPISCEMGGGGGCDPESTGGVVFEMNSDDTERQRQDFRRLVRLLVGIQGDEAVFRLIVLWL